MTALLGNPEVNLVIYGEDRYGRTIAEVIRTVDGRNVNLIMVENGSAFTYWQYMQCDETEYFNAEGFAFTQALGVWNNDVAVMQPWEWRRL